VVTVALLVQAGVALPLVLVLLEFWEEMGSLALKFLSPISLLSDQVNESPSWECSSWCFCPGISVLGHSYNEIPGSTDHQQEALSSKVLLSHKIGVLAPWQRRQNVSPGLQLGSPGPKENAQKIPSLVP
jgi:hypothetical protein